MEEKLQVEQVEEQKEEKKVFVIPHEGEEIYEERYIVCKKWKRVVAFFIDFILMMALIYIMNMYVTRPLVYDPIWKFNEKDAQTAQELKDYAGSLGILDENGELYDTAADAGKTETDFAGDIVMYWAKYQELLKPFTNYGTFTKIIDSTWALVLVYIVPTIFFKNGRTLGKKIMKLLVIDSFGQPVKFFPYLYREVVGFWAVQIAPSFFLYFLPILMVGVLYTFISQKSRALHDVLFGTYVVDEVKQTRLVYYEPELVTEEEVKPEDSKLGEEEEYY